jgi:hypothetical protein
MRGQEGVEAKEIGSRSRCAGLILNPHSSAGIGRAVSWMIGTLLLAAEV